MVGDTGEERGASPPALLAYTTSGSQNVGKKGARGGQKGAGASRQRSATGARGPAATKRFRKSTEPVLFDESSRRDFLTGFRKRKQARIETSRKKALEREKEERRKMRSDARQARKDQAAENVRMEKIAYGDGLNDEDDGEGEDIDGEEEQEQREQSPSAYETEEHHTTVTVQEWNPDEIEEDVPDSVAKPIAVDQAPVKSTTQGQRKAQSINAALPPSSRRMAKKLKNSSDSALSSQRKAEASEISKLLDLGKAPVAAPIPVFHAAGDGSNKTSSSSSSLIKKKPKFHYESKLERAKAKAKINEDRAKHAERRKEERLLAERGGKPKGGRRRK